MIKFSKLSASGSGSRNFLKVSSTLRDRAFFHNLDYISGVSDWIFVKIFIADVSLDKEVPLNFGSNLDPESLSGSGLRIQTRFSLVEMCTL